MSDDMWRDRGDDDFSEFGSLFDDTESGERPGSGSRPAEPGGDDEPLSFGESHTGPLPHWTDPATGEVPRFDEPEAGVVDDEEVDVWSTFSSDAPVWKDDPNDGAAHAAPAEGRRGTGEHDVAQGRTPRQTGEHRRVSSERRGSSSEHPRVQRVTGSQPVTTPEQGRISIGTDPSGIPRSGPAPKHRSRGRNSGQQAHGSSGTASAGRDMPLAVAVGAALAAAFFAALVWRPIAVAALITVILGLAAVEFYEKVTEKGYRPVLFPGVALCVAAPVAAYWLGELSIPLALAFGFMAVAASMLGARGLEAGPLPNISITAVGMIWIGLLGSFAMLILRLSTQTVSAFESEQLLAANRGTDTLFLIALGVVANDVGALVFGSSFGRTPLKPWISPNKSVEGLIGGGLATIIVLMMFGIFGPSTTWVSNWDILAMALVISVLAPVGDLVESMFKRNLDVKDFGTLIRGHGGVLDRFDGFLFVLPGAYYLTLVLEPWTKYVAS